MGGKALRPLMRPQRAVWDAIAEGFDRTRGKPWPHVEEFLRTLPAGTRVLDLMAGNGRHAKVADALGLDCVALDWSRPLLATAKRRHGSVLGDAACLPFADASFGACAYVAGLHGIPSTPGRFASLRELRRVLRPGAPVQVTVWSRRAPRFRDLPPDQHDVIVPWKAGGLHEKRKYHLYTPDSLRIHLAAAGFLVDEVREVRIAADDADNLVAVVRCPT